MATLEWHGWHRRVRPTVTGNFRTEGAVLSRTRWVPVKDRWRIRRQLETSFQTLRRTTLRPCWMQEVSRWWNRRPRPGGTRNSGISPSGKRSWPARTSTRWSSRCVRSAWGRQIRPTISMCTAPRSSFPDMNPFAESCQELARELARRTSTWR